jgi:hypothetical protein
MIIRVFMTLSKKISNLINLSYWLLLNDNKQDMPKAKKDTIWINSNSGKIYIDTYRPNKIKPHKSCLLTVGLNPNGARDIRAKKFASILTKAGYLVYVPLIRDYMDLYIKKDTYNDFAACFDKLVLETTKIKEQRPDILAISFSSLLALKLTSDPQRKNKANKLFMFGGYLDWFGTCKAILQKETIDKKIHSFDVRVVPIIFNHILDDIFNQYRKEEINYIRSSILDYIKITWEEGAPKEENKLLEIAAKYTKNFSKEKENIFLQCLGLKEGSWDLFIKHAKNPKYNYLNPVPEATYEQITTPTYLIHSYQDEVISVSQFYLLKKHLPNIKHSFLSSYYEHADKKPGNLLTLIKKHLKDAINFIYLFWALSQ